MHFGCISGHLDDSGLSSAVCHCSGVVIGMELKGGTICLGKASYYLEYLNEILKVNAVLIADFKNAIIFIL